MRHLNANYRYIIGAMTMMSVPIILLLFCSDMEGKLSMCPFMRFLHIPCPGCGLSKSLLCLAQGHWQKSICYHPFGIVIELVAALVLLLSIIDIRKKTDMAYVLLNQPLLWRVMAMAFGIFYISRLVFYFSGQWHRTEAYILAPNFKMIRDKP